MNGYVSATQTYEEKRGLFDDRSLSDIESDSGRHELDPSFSVDKWAGYSGAAAEYVRSMPWRVMTVRLMWFLVPSFLQGRHARDQIRPNKLAPTAYLDGMRGVAALFVFFCHFLYQGFKVAEGWGNGESNYYILKLPIIRLWYQGPPAVCVFFVISGYALSYKPTKLMRARNMHELSVTMSSLIFRRGLRLFLPTAISTLMIVFLVQGGFYELTRPFAMNRAYIRGYMEPHPYPLVDNYAQLRNWFQDMYDFVHVWSWKTHGGSTNYDQHLWTIPVEFRCSLYLFLTLIGTARLRTKYRFLTLLGVMLFTYRNSRWEPLLFFVGMALAEMDHIRGAHVTPTLPVDEKKVCKSSRLDSFLWNFIIFAGMYLMCQPDEFGSSTPGWVYLTSLIPKWWMAEQYRYWQSIGAVLFVLGVGHSPTWQSFFNQPAVQYLGKISYALYLMHGPVIHALGYHLELWAFNITGIEGNQYIYGYILSAFLVVPATIWIADVFWRVVDIPTVKFAKWWENKLIMKDE